MKLENCKKQSREKNTYRSGGKGLRYLSSKMPQDIILFYFIINDNFFHPINKVIHLSLANFIAQRLHPWLLSDQFWQVLPYKYINLN